MRTLLAFGAVWLLTASVGAAQTSLISGRIVDQSGTSVTGATVTAAGASGTFVTTSGPAGEYRFTNKPMGTYRILITLVGFAPAVQDGVVVNAAGAEVPTVTLRIASVSETVVVSATKSDHTLIDSPATLSVIDGTVLKTTAAANFADLLRAVPGMNVIQLSARDFNVTNRQATSTMASSQLVLLDDRPIYLDFFGLVFWDFLPVDLANVKQIEVIRGPASAVWGANAQTGVVNVITKSPRETLGTAVSLSAGAFSRAADSTLDRGLGSLFGANVTVARAPIESWSYRLSAGYFHSDPLSRPTGRIPRIQDPRDPSQMVGGGFYPIDGQGDIGTAFQNAGTSQPKFETRVDQEIADGRVTYGAGIASTSGIVHTSLGPFDMRRGSMSHANVTYRKRALKINAFANYATADGPNLLLVDPVTQQPLQIDFTAHTFDVEVINKVRTGSRDITTVGGNVRRNTFDITLAPKATDVTDLGVFLGEEVLFERVRLDLSGRIDKFGHLSRPVLSPRLATIFNLTQDQSVRVSYNRAFRAPPDVFNYLRVSVVSPTDLSASAPLLPATLQPLVSEPFPLVVDLVGSRIPVGGKAQRELTEESLKAYEIGYTATFRGKMTIGASVYVNDLDQTISFAQLPENLDPYTEANPPPGWQLPPSILTEFARQGVFLPRTGFSYANQGPVRQKGVELSVDHRIKPGMTSFVNYSWQARPRVLEISSSLQPPEIALPPTNRFNAGFNFNAGRMLGGASVNYSSRAFWSDVLLSPYFGFSESYAMLSGSFGLKWADGRVVTLVKATNVTNSDIQQHIFGDLIKRSIVAEVRLTSVRNAQ